MIPTFLLPSFPSAIPTPVPSALLCSPRANLFCSEFQPLLSTTKVQVPTGTDSDRNQCGRVFLTGDAGCRARHVPAGWEGGSLALPGVVEGQLCVCGYVQHWCRRAEQGTVTGVTGQRGDQVTAPQAGERWQSDRELSSSPGVGGSVWQVCAGQRGRCGIVP